MGLLVQIFMAYSVHAGEKIAQLKTAGAKNDFTATVGVQKFWGKDPLFENPMREYNKKNYSQF